MNDFWARKLGTVSQPTAPSSTAGTSTRVWWQEPDPLPQTSRYQQLSPDYAEEQPAGMTQQQEQQLFQQLLRVPADKLSAEQMEFMAQFELKRPKYNQVCPQCGSGNFIPHGTRAGSVTMSTDKCFDCGFSARGPEPALSGRGSSSGSATRQIDTGGGAGPSLYMSFQRVPSSYMPRG
jgi:hypothetical protein